LFPTHEFYINFENLLAPSVPLYGDYGDNNGAVESAVATVAR